MTFVNEIASDADIDKYGLPFPKGSGRYWTRDKERDMYLWGGKVGNPAFGEEIEGVFELYIGGVTISVRLQPGMGSRSYSEVPYQIEWLEAKILAPKTLDRHDQDKALTILKEALVAYGEDGRDNKYAPKRETRFHF